MNYYKIIAWKSKMTMYQQKGETTVRATKYIYFIEGKEEAKSCLRSLKFNGYDIESIKAITKEQYMKQEVNA